jgi:proline dehydrogenase
MGFLDSILLPVAKRFIAGPNLEDAVKVSKEMNTKGFKVIINFLGEEIKDRKQLADTINEYLAIFDAMDANRIEGSVSVKLTQLGLLFGIDEATKNLHTIVERAKRSARYLWVDMEGSSYTSAIIQVYLKELKNYDRMGIAIQSYLRRTAADVDELIRNGGQIRLCKGAYDEPPDVAFKDRREIQQNYSRMMKRLFSQNSFFAIATHDDRLQDEAKELAKVSRPSFEFQMLRGVREELGLELLKGGYNLSVYLPYGATWLPYSIRRMKERKRNILLLFRALVSG